MIKYDFKKVDLRKAGNIPDGLIDDIIDSTIRKNAPADIAEQLIEASLDDIQPGGDPRFVRENLNAVAEMNKRLVKAGIDINALQGGTGGLHSILPTVGRLQGDVPGPYIQKDDKGRERRTHLTYENANDGVRGVVPYMDPSNLKQPLKTVFGDVSGTAAAYYDNPSEYVGAQALKLMGIEAERGNQDKILRNGRQVSAHWKSDLVDPNSSQGRIDVERGDVRLDKNTLPLQLTAVLKPSGMHVSNSNRRSFNEGSASLVEFINRNKDINNVIEGVEGIRGSRFATHVPDHYYYGKGFKTADKGKSADERMDKILSLEYGSGADAKDRQGVSAAPRDVNMINVPETMAYIEEQGRNYSGTDSRSPVYLQSIDYADSAGGKIDKRSKVKANIPKGATVQQGNARRGVGAGSKANYRVIDENPLVQQLLNVLPYI